MGLTELVDTKRNNYYSTGGMNESDRSVLWSVLNPQSQSTGQAAENNQIKNESRFTQVYHVCF